MRAVVKRGSGGIWEKSAEPQPWKGKGHEICVNRKSLEWQNYISQLYSNYFSSLSLSLFPHHFFATKSTSKIRPQFYSSPSSRIFSIFVFFFFFHFPFFLFYELFQRKIRSWTSEKFLNRFAVTKEGAELLIQKWPSVCFTFYNWFTAFKAYEWKINTR